MTRYVNRVSTYAVGIIFPVLGTIAVALRLLARKSARSRYGWDDGMAVAALILVIACGAIMIYGAATQAIGWTPPDGTELPPSTHPSPERAEAYILTQKLKYPLLLLSIIAIGLIRLTFVLLYNRIFEFKRFRLVSLLMIGIITSWIISFFFALLFTCGTHFTANWGSTQDLATYCNGEFALDNAMAISDVIIDIIILLLPIVPTYQLQMSLQRKLLVLVVFSLGAFSIAASLARTVLSVQLSNFKYGSPGKLFGIEAMADPGGVVSVVLWWTYVEIGIGCLVSNLPPTVGLVRGRSKTVLQFFGLSKGGSRSSESAAHLNGERSIEAGGNESRGRYNAHLSDLSSVEEAEKQDVYFSTSSPRG